jgi:hypothetical protein
MASLLDVVIAEAKVFQVYHEVLKSKLVSSLLRTYPQGLPRSQNFNALREAWAS